MMDTIDKLCFYYLYTGVDLLVVNALISLFKSESLRSAIALEATRCGIKEEDAATRSLLHNTVACIMYWPKGLANTVTQFISRFTKS